MSRQIQALEDDLGTPLFHRRHRALELTDAGMRLLAVCTTVLAQLRETAAAIRAPTAREQLAVTTTPSFASLWLIPRLAGFTGAHPGVDVRLDASFERRDLKRDGFDLAVRYGLVGSTEGQRLFGESIVPVCSPALLKRPMAPWLRRPTWCTTRCCRCPWGRPAAVRRWTGSRGCARWARGRCSRAPRSR
jgi:DNA-binding transcriptional LysR family regulator